MKHIAIDPVTRLEGHGKIDIFLSDDGEVENCYFVIPELRGFEQFCVGRPVEEMPRITTRLCGVCPEAHHIASVKACDAVYHVEPPPTARKLRELLYHVFFAGDHTLHFYALGGPDFILGPDAPAAQRNILGVIGKVGVEVGKKVIRMRAHHSAIMELLGGKKVHQVTSIPGGVSKGLTEDERKSVEGRILEMVEFAKFTIKVFDDIVLKNKAYLDLITGNDYKQKIHSMGLVDQNKRLNFYDGKVRVVDTEGKEIALYTPDSYLEYVAEHVEPWTYLKFPYLKKIGWKGFSEGSDSGVYRATPLSRLNACEGLSTPLAQKEYERMFSTLGGKPVHATLATHWARVIELLYAAERALELVRDPEITGKEIRTIPTAVPTEGVGIVEAPRGTLTHHYATDERGLVRKVNLIVGTTNNHAAISMSIKKAAQGLIRKGVEVNEGVLNRIEMAFRAFDPCFGCATHTLGRIPLEIFVRDSSGTVLQQIMRE
ncbi:MAG TPA: Ni/Fe hydrogenase subunit alpha [Bacteroidota bacterium]|nr:Ni/Fe hydrogenase subunit alpha [Bacteroidota bacterium]